MKRFEAWDDNTFFDAFVGGFVIYPDNLTATADASGRRTAEITARLLWDWKEPQSVTRTGFARVTVRFLKRESPANAESTRKEKQ